MFSVHCFYEEQQKNIISVKLINWKIYCSIKELQSDRMRAYQFFYDYHILNSVYIRMRTTIQAHQSVFDWKLFPWNFNYFTDLMTQNWLLTNFRFRALNGKLIWEWWYCCCCYCCCCYCCCCCWWWLIIICCWFGTLKCFRTVPPLRMMKCWVDFYVFSKKKKYMRHIVTDSDGISIG